MTAKAAIEMGYKIVSKWENVRVALYTALLLLFPSPDCQ